MKRTVFAIIAVLLSAASAKVWYVHPDSTLHSIQAAVESCDTSDTVLVGPGTYQENIDWPDSVPGIRLVSELGRDSTIIDGGGSHVITMIGPKAMNLDSLAPVVTGFTVRNGGTGIDVFWFAPPVIKDNLITGNDVGIGVLMNSATITGNTIKENGTGISGNDFFGGTIVRNVISSNAGTGIALSFAPKFLPDTRPDPMTIDSCTISNNNAYGIWCSQLMPGDVEVHHCDIWGNTGYGIYNHAYSVNAQDNWWGDSTGPFHPDSNPGGLGDTVSDGVVFRPWLPGPVGLAEEAGPRPALGSLRAQPGPSLVRGVISLPPRSAAVMLDIGGRRVMTLASGVNDVSHLTPGVYFIREEPQPASPKPQTVRKVVVTR